MSIRSLSVGLASAAALACAGVVARPATPPVADRPEASVHRRAALGAGSCAAAACHGGVAEVAGEPRSRLAHTIWAYRDEKHSRAYKALLGNRSVGIVKNLGWAAADQEPRCLACHATPAVEVAGASADAIRSEGVGCEACHGPAGGWITGHATESWHKLAAVAKREEQVRVGMRPTADLSDRVGACVGCHVGAAADPDSPFPVRREVDHDMIAAGHPRLSFEFASYHDLMPHHWDAPPGDRGPEAAARRWLVGRLGAEVAALDLLRDRADRAACGAPWPEFSESDCFSCHHDLRDEAWRRPGKGSRRGADEPSWGTWYFADADLLADPSTPAGEAARSRLQELRKAMNAPSPAAGDVAARATTAREALVHLQRESSARAPTRADVERLILGLDPALRTAPPATWDQATQAYLGLVQLRTGGGDAELARLRQMGRDLGLPEKADSPTGFDPTRFGARDRSVP